MREYDLELVARKCIMLGSAVAATTQATVEKGVRIPFAIAGKGIERAMDEPVGLNVFCLDRVCQQVYDMVPIIPIVLQLHSQSAHVLLTQCICSKVSYLSRVCKTP